MGRMGERPDYQYQPLTFEDVAIGEQRHVVNGTGRTEVYLLDWGEDRTIAFSVPAGSCFTYKGTKHPPKVFVKGLSEEKPNPCPA